MKKFPATLAALMVSSMLPLFSSAQNVELTKLGTTAFAVDPDSTSASYSQTANSLTFTAFDSGASSNLLAGFLNAQPLNWSIYTSAPYVTFGLNMSVSGVNPDTSFSVDFYSADGIVDTYVGSTTGLTGSLSLTNLSFSAPGTGDYSAIIGIGFSWNGQLSSPNTVTVESVYAVVPEPSTYALLALSGLALGGYAMRRRRRA